MNSSLQQLDLLIVWYFYVTVIYFLLTENLLEFTFLEHRRLGATVSTLTIDPGHSKNVWSIHMFLHKYLPWFGLLNVIKNL